jgi:hypothetical protein
VRVLLTPDPSLAGEGASVKDETPDFSPIVIGEYTATWEPLPYVSQFLSGRRDVLVRPVWVIRNGENFVGIADQPEEVQKLVRFAQTRPVQKAA